MIKFHELVQDSVSLSVASVGLNLQCCWEHGTLSRFHTGCLCYLELNWTSGLLAVWLSSVLRYWADWDTVYTFVLNLLPCLLAVRWIESVLRFLIGCLDGLVVPAQLFSTLLDGLMDILLLRLHKSINRMIHFFFLINLLIFWSIKQQKLPITTIFQSLRRLDQISYFTAQYLFDLKKRAVSSAFWEPENTSYFNFMCIVLKKLSN